MGDVGSADFAGMESAVTSALWASVSSRGKWGQMLVPTSGLLRELKQERCNAPHIGGVGPRLGQG